MTYVITVVHGTTFRSRLVALLRAVFWPVTKRQWLRPCRTAREVRARTAWLEPGSPLRNALRGLGPRDTVRVYPFLWSGRNRVKARSDAAGRLARKLALRFDQYPEARHFVVAHSHGGNIALYALRHAFTPDRRSKLVTTIGSRLEGVVCLSTPFLHVRRRSLGRSALALAWTAVLLAGSAAIAFTRILPSAWRSIRVAGDSLTFWLGMLVAMVTLMVLAAAFFWCRRESERLLAAMAIDASRNTRVFTIRAPGDEASVTLGAAEFLLWLINSIWSRVWLAFDRASTWVRTQLDARPRALRQELLAGLALWLVFASGLWLYWGGPPAFDRPVTWLFAAPMVAAGAAVVFAFLALAGGYAWGPLIALLWGISALLLLPFGGRLAIAAAFLDISVGWSPPGHSESMLLPDGAAGSALAHSASYQDPVALEAVADWIRGTPALPHATD